MKDDKMLKTVQFIIIMSLPFLTDYYFPLKEIIKPPYTYIGILIILVGIYLSVKTSLIFRQANNSFTLKGESLKLVTDDVFSFSRNPMYLGILIVFTGLAVYLGSLSVFIYPIFFFFFSNKIISYEEEKLEKIYGQDYINYSKRVRRWI